MCKLLLTILGVFTLVSAHAAPIDFTFSYTWDGGGSLSGVARGDLQADNDTIIVTDLLQSNYSLDPALVFPTDLFDDPNTAGADANIVYLSGANPINFGTTPSTVSGDPSWIIGFELGGGSIIAGLTSGPGMNLELEPVGTGTWQITAVPAPPAAWLLLTGLAGLGLSSWRGRQQAAA